MFDRFSVDVSRKRGVGPGEIGSEWNWKKGVLDLLHLTYLLLEKIVTRLVGKEDLARALSAEAAQTALLSFLTTESF